MTTAQDNYAANAKIIKAAEAAADQAAKSAWQSYMKGTGLSDQFGLKVQTTCYKKKPKGFSKVISEIAMRLTYQNGLEKTQIQIIEEVRKKFPEHNIQPNVWNKPLAVWEHRAITTIIRGNMQKPIDIKRCKTLAEIRKLMKADKIGDDAVHTFKPTIKISKDQIVIGKKIYPIELRKSGGYEYPSIRVPAGDKRQWVRVDAIISLLG